jgi:predicted RNase H-like HicB family nuclease
MKRYAIVLEDAGPNWAAYVPDLPGCVATAATAEEAGRLIREAIEVHLEGLAEDGLPAPEPSSRVEYVEVSAAPVAAPDLGGTGRPRVRRPPSRRGR